MLRFFDGFDYYPGADLTLRWGTVFLGGYNMNTANTPFGVGQALRIDVATGSVSKVIDSQQTWTIGLRWRAKTVGAGYQALVQLIDGAVVHITIAVNGTNKRIGIYRGTTAGTLLAESANDVWVDDSWCYTEFKVKIADSPDGTYEVRVNGTAVIGPTVTVDTRNAGNASADTVKILGVSNTSPSTLFDDVYFVDGAAGDYTTFIGDVRVTTLRPNGAGNYTQFTPSAGSNYQCVDDTTENGDTDYVSDTVAGHKDSYTFEDLVGSPQVFAVNVNNVWRKDDAGTTRQARSLTRIGILDYNGTTRTLGTSYSFDSTLYALSPATGIAWTAVEVNAAEFGLELVA